MINVVVNNVIVRRARSRIVKTQHAGAVLVLVMICLSIVMMLSFSIVKSTLLTASRVRTEQASRSAEWLLYAGGERALQQLAANVAYSGEQWSLPIQLAGEQQSAQIQIGVKPTADPELRRIELRATCYSFRGLTVVRSKTIHIRIQLPQTGEST